MAQDDPAPSEEMIDLAQMAQELGRLQRARDNAPDWETLFRHIRSAMETLAQHPFVVGDLEAENRLRWLCEASTLEELDARTDHLAEYLMGKLHFNQTVRALAEGKTPPPAPRLSAETGQSSAATRAAASTGVSGSDFEIPDQTDQSHPQDTAPRRERLRL